MPSPTLSDPLRAWTTYSPIRTVTEISPEEVELQRRLITLPRSIRRAGLLGASRSVLRRPAPIPKRPTWTWRIPEASVQCKPQHDLPILSSHAKLHGEIQTRFIDGVEYRNCFGLWLAENGDEAPESGRLMPAERCHHAM